MPLAAAPKSSTAMSAATLDPGPARAAYGPDSSLRTPILTIPPEIWAWACSPARPSTAKSVRTLAAQPAETRMFSRALLTPRDHRGASRIPAATARMKRGRNHVTLRWRPNPVKSRHNARHNAHLLDTVPASADSPSSERPGPTEPTASRRIHDERTHSTRRIETGRRRRGGRGRLSGRAPGPAERASRAGPVVLHRGFLRRGARPRP